MSSTMHDTATHLRIRTFTNNLGTCWKGNTVCVFLGGHLKIPRELVTDPFADVERDQGILKHVLFFEVFDQSYDYF